MFNEKQYRKEYYLKNKEKILDRSKKRYEEKSEEIAKYQNDLYRTKNGRIIRSLASAKKNAKKRGIFFDIDLEYLRSIAPDKCPVFGTTFNWTNWGENEGKAKPNTPSIDRIDSSKGYIKGNVQWVSYLANSMKTNATAEQLIKFSEWIERTYKNDKTNSNTYQL